MAYNHYAHKSQFEEGEGEKSPTNKKVKQSSLHLSFFLLFIIFNIFLGLFTNLIFHESFFTGQKIKNSIQNDNLSQILCNSIQNDNLSRTLCSSLTNNTICCDRTNYHSDICFMLGDVRTHSPSSSIFLYSANNNTIILQEEKIKPYTRKWERNIMDTIDELHLRTVQSHNSSLSCDVYHHVPALFFSAGGYTGNLFHAFNNGLLPLYITSQHLHRQVIFVVLQYSYWWSTKYQEILTQLSNYPPIDFFNDSRIHCFPGAIVGLYFHRTLSINPEQLFDNKSIRDFHYMLDKAYRPQMEHNLSQNLKERNSKPPKLVIMSRNGTRIIENEEEVLHLGKDIGFDVEVLKPEDTMTMARIYQSLSSCDVMIGVHGAALTHFLFMRPGSTFIQIIPLGIDQLASFCFEESATRMGLRYKKYKILPRESSLYKKYGKDDPVVKDPNSIKAKGWEIVKKVYLDGQNIKIDLNRLRKTLVEAFQYVNLEKRY